MSSFTPNNDSNNPGGLHLQAIGQWLKESREQKGESLDDIAKITRIGKDYLDALECGTVSKLPSQAYTRGFIRLYASHLGFSPEEIARQMNVRLEYPPLDLLNTTFDLSSTLATGQRTSLPGRTKKLLLSVICIGAIAGVTLFIVNRKSILSSATGSRQVAATPSAMVNAPALPVTEPPAPKIDTPPVATALNQGNGEIITEESIILRLKALSAGRLHITIDDSVSQEYDLVAGDLIEWKADKKFILDLENAGSVEGNLDGNPLMPFGETGKSAHLIIRQDGVHKN